VRDLTLVEAPDGRAAVHLRRLEATVIIAMLSGLALSPRLWLSSGRTYPASPVTDWLSPVPFPWDYVWLAALVALLCAALGSRARRGTLAAFVAMAAALALFDQTRWQPWFYQYLLMMTAFVLCARSDMRDVDSPAFDVCRLVVATVYFWSGAQKLSVEFGATVVPGLLTGAVGSTALRQALVSAGWAVPVIEMSIGVGLLTSRAGRTAAGAAVLMHLAVLGLLASLRENVVVWPWNVAMAVFCLQFWRDRGFSRGRLWTGLRWHERCALIALLLLFPALGWLGRWDAYPSFSLYSGRTSVGLLHIDGPLLARLPAPVRPHVEADPLGGFILPLDRWSYAELHVPPYPELRVYRRVARSVCATLAEPEDLRLETLDPPGRLSREWPLSRLRCSQLTARRVSTEGYQP
jgi:hypothetical protein